MGQDFTVIIQSHSKLTISEVSYYPLYPYDVIATTLWTEVLHAHGKVVSNTRGTCSLIKKNTQINTYTKWRIAAMSFFQVG